MFREAIREEYEGFLELEFTNANDKTTVSKRNFNGLIKASRELKRENGTVPLLYIIGLGGGYVEGEKYKYIFTLKDNAKAVITTQASTKVYKSPNKIATEQETSIYLERNSVLEYITDSLILYKDAVYKQKNNIYMDKSSTLIYSDGITSGWAPDGSNFSYNTVQLKNNIYIDNELVLLDNLVINPRENDVSKLGFFEEYLCFGTLIVINSSISHNVIEDLRELIKNENLSIDYGITELEVPGFVLRVLANLTQDIDHVISICHNYVRRNFLGSKELDIRKY